MEKYPPVAITLPWLRSGGTPLTRHLIFTDPIGSHIWRSGLNEDHWKLALAAVVIIPKAWSRERAASRENGMHALRHFYASVLA
ncbi:hypothetical protein [Streptacidiphilus sp. N1-5]|uniref:Uncharacterized protein n=1 Tax=Streptacidiphilus cavernicola TaxID=3342716 RepID=A0ABV6URE3_9ACTN